LAREFTDGLELQEDDVGVDVGDEEPQESSHDELFRE
jgi:hypothetical protein